MPRVLHFSAVHSHCSYTPCLKPKPAPIRGVHNVVNEHQLLGFLNTSYSTYYMTSPEAQCRGCISSLVYNIKCYKGSTVTTNSMSATKAKWSLHAWLPTRHTYTTYPSSSFRLLVVYKQSKTGAGEGLVTRLEITVTQVDEV